MRRCGANIPGENGTLYSFDVGGMAVRWEADNRQAGSERLNIEIFHWYVFGYVF